MNKSFVLVACGDEHVRRANLSIKYLRKFAKCDIIGIVARSTIDMDVDTQIKVKDFAGHPTNEQCSRVMKTNIFWIFKEIWSIRDERFCYLDNDVFAVSDQIMSVFDQLEQPISFALDPGKTVKRFSKYALKYGDLDQAIATTFKVDVDRGWKIWNGGLFVFDRKAAEFFQIWHRYTMEAFKDPRWETRDQGTLIATVWKLGLQHHKTLPPEYNWLHKLQGGLVPLSDGFMNKRGNRVHFLHFPVTYGNTRYQCWNNLMNMMEKK